MVRDLIGENEMIFNFYPPHYLQRVVEKKNYAMIKILKGSFMMNDCDNGGKPDPYCPENLVPHKERSTATGLIYNQKLLAAIQIL